MKAPTLKMIFALLLAVCCCSVRGQNYPGASQYWSSQHQQQPQQQQQQQQPQQFQQAFPNQQQRQQPQQQLAGQNPYRAQQLGFGQPNGQQGMQQQQQQQPQQPGFQQQPQQPGFQQQQPQQPGFQQGLQQQRQQPAFRQQFGSAAGDDSTRLRIGETTPSPFQNRLFSGASDSPSAGLGAPNGTGAPGSPGAPGAPGAPSASSAPGGALGQQDSNALELEPFGNVKQPQPGRPDSQVFQTPTDQALYAVDWSYPRARHAPASLVLKRWGGLSPPEYVAVYRLRGPTPSASSALHAADLAASPSYSLLRDEMRHYPWDAARRHGPPRWHGAPRDEDFELLPAGTPLGHHHGVDGHYGSSQNYMFRTL